MGYMVTNGAFLILLLGDSMNITTTAMVAALNRAGLVLSNESDTNLKAALRYDTYTYARGRNESFFKSLIGFVA